MQSIDSMSLRKVLTDLERSHHPALKCYIVLNKVEKSIYYEFVFYLSVLHEGIS